MSRRSLIRIGYTAIAVLVIVGVSVVVRAGIYSGTITAANAKSRRITVESSNGQSKSFRVPDSAELTIDDEQSELASVTAGQRASVYYDASGAVTRVRIRTPQDPPPAGESASKKPAPRDDAPATGAGGQQSALPGWPQFLGPGRDNRSGDAGLMDAWPTGGPPLALRADGLGTGYSSVSLGDGKIFTMGAAADESVIALDAQTGETVWQTPIGQKRPDGMGGGPRGTPTVDDDRVYALGANGDLACLAIDDGRLLWSTNILEQFGGGNIQWGISESVLIDGDHLICTPGGRQATMAALDKHSGDVVWRARAPDSPAAAYASTIVVEVKGVRQYVNFTHTSVIGVRADNGDFLWSNAASANGTANCSSPVSMGDHIFSSSGYGQGCALVKITGRRGRAGADLVYANKVMQNHHGGLVRDGEFIYGADQGVLKCLKMIDGKVMWQDRSVGKGAVVYADGKIFLRSEQGPLAMVAATPDEYRELGRFDQPDRSGQSAWARPVVADGRLYLRDQELLLVYDLRGE